MVDAIDTSECGWASESLMDRIVWKAGVLGEGDQGYC